MVLLDIPPAITVYNPPTATALLGVTMIRFCLALLLLIFTTTSGMAAAAKDLIGTWTVDAEATWNKLKDLPQVKALPPEVANTAKSAFVTQSAGMVFIITDKKITTTIGGTTREESYEIISIDGEVITAEGTDPEGKKERSLIRIIEGGMELTSVSDPMQKVVLRKKDGDSTSSETKPKE